jgi:hypothetical protein
VNTSGADVTEAQLGFNIGELGHSNCRANLMHSSTAPVTNGSELALKMVFHNAMAGGVPVFGQAVDSSNAWYPFTQAGSWSVPSGPRADSINFVVRQSYLDFLMRDPESQAVIDWRSGFPRSSLVKDLYESAEFSGTGGFTARAYRTLLGRDVEAGGWRFQAGAIKRGIQSTWGLLGGLIYSAEFQQRYPAALSDNKEFIRVLYRNALLREPSTQEVDNHAVQTWTSREDKAQAFMNSQEFELKHGNRIYAHLLYVILLRRDSGPGDADWWADQMNAGRSRESVAESFLGSAEYGLRFP